MDATYSSSLILHEFMYDIKALPAFLVLFPCLVEDEVNIEMDHATWIEKGLKRCDVADHGRSCLN